LGGISGEFWPRGSCVAARGARAAGGYAGDRVSANAEWPPSRIVSNAAFAASAMSISATLSFATLLP
jgi:hypothetical protein